MLAEEATKINIGFASSDAAGYNETSVIEALKHYPKPIMLDDWRLKLIFMV
jgi:hypothetical protein